MERRPMWRALRLTVGRPWVWWVPVAVDLGKWLLALLLVRYGLYWVEWDFGAAYPLPLGDTLVHVSLPLALPGVSALGVTVAPPASDNASWLQWVTLAGMLAATVALKAGYLNLLNALVHEAPPTRWAFMRGVQRFTLRLALLAALWVVPVLGIERLQAEGVLGATWAAVWLLVLTAWFGLAQFVLVTDDVGPVRALLGVPLLVAQQAAFVTAVLSSALLLTGALGALLSWLELTSPVWGMAPAALLGTWLSISLLGALQIELNTQVDPTGRSAWPCPNCHAQNRQRAAACVACGQSRVTPTLALAQAAGKNDTEA
jgi:hypothetical protein